MQTSDDLDKVSQTFSRVVATAFTVTMADQDEEYWRAFRAVFAHHLDLLASHYSDEVELTGSEDSQLLTLVDLAKACLFSEVTEAYRVDPDRQ